MLVLGLIHDLFAGCTVVGLVRGAVIAVGLSHNEDVVTTAERVLEDGGGAKVDIGVVTRRLSGGRAIEIPLAQLADVRNLLVYSLFRRRFVEHEKQTPSRCARAR